MKLDGTFKGRLFNHRTGEITCWEKHNAIVATGFDWVMNLLSNNSSRPKALGYMGFGTGSTATTSDMTALVNEVFRAAVTSTWDSTTHTLTFSGSLPAGSGIEANITETGLFTENTGGIMFDRAFFSPKGIDNDTGFDFDFVIVISE